MNITSSIKRLLLLLLFAASVKGQTITSSFLQVSAPACAASAFQNVPYTCQIAPTGGIPPYSFTLNSGGGSGLSMSTGSGGGLLSGTPTGTSLVNFSMTVADSGNSSQTLTIGVTPGSLSSITVTPTGQTVQTTNTLQLSALGLFTNSNGTGVNLSSLATWSCTGTPCGTVSSSGLYTAGSSGGTATIKAVFSGVTDDGGSGIAVTVTGTAPPFFVTTSLCPGQINQVYPENTSSCVLATGQQLSCTAGTAPYTFALGTLTLQSGLSLSSSGLINGTPTASGTNTGTVTCTDSLSHTGTSSSMSLVIASLSSIATTLSNSTILANQTSQATPTGTYSDSTTAIVPNGVVTWTSSNTACATVNNTGLVTALNVGATCTSSIKAAVGAVNGSVTLTVNPVSSATASFIQWPHNDSCAASTSACTVTLTQATGVGTAVYGIANGVIGTSVTLSSVTDGGDTFTNITSSTQSGVSNSMAVAVSGAGSKTSLTCNLSANSTGVWTCAALEFSTNSTGFSFDTSGNVANSSANTTANGVGLTLTGNDVVVQNAFVSSSHPTAISPSSYVLNKDGNGDAESYILNTTSGTAPTYTFAASSTSGVSAIAIKQAGGAGGGTTRTAASCNLSDVQATINLSVTGDTVQIPGPCTTTWANFATVATSQGITIKPSGGTVTITAGPNSAGTQGFQINQGSATTRITGFTCNSTSSDAQGHCVQTFGNTTSAPFRIDNWFMCGGGGSCTAFTTFISLNGNGPGLIDHNTMECGSSCDAIQNFGMQSGNNAGWQDDIIPGGPGFVFHENNTVINESCLSSCNWPSSSYIQAYYGARNVFRYNTFQMMNIDEHGSQGGGNECPGGGSACTGAVGVRYWDINNNTFVVVPGGNWFSYMDLRAGTGVVWNNHITGTNIGAGRIQLYEENSLSWPQAYQVGSGLNDITSPHASCSGLNQSPAYLWGNDTGFAVNSSNGVSGAVQINRDYFAPGSPPGSGAQPATLNSFEKNGDSCSTTFAYVSYVYPHPLDK